MIFGLSSSWISFIDSYLHPLDRTTITSLLKLVCPRILFCASGFVICSSRSRPKGTIKTPTVFCLITSLFSESITIKVQRTPLASEYREVYFQPLRHSFIFSLIMEAIWITLTLCSHASRVIGTPFSSNPSLRTTDYRGLCLIITRKGTNWDNYSHYAFSSLLIVISKA